MEDDRTPKQAMQADHNVNQEDRIDTILVDLRQDLKSICMTWEDVEQSVINRDNWCRSVAQCVYDTTRDDLSLSRITRL